MITGKVGVSFIASLVGLHLLSAAFFKPADLKTAHGRRSKLDSANAGTVIIGNQTPGPTPFIAQISATVSPANSLKSVQFSVTPKPGSVTRPISATYSSNYLQSRGYLNTGTGAVIIPVFGLYANFSNTAILTFFFTDGSSQQNSVPIPTADWTDTCGVYKNPTVLQARTGSTTLSYDYIMVKNDCGSESPVIIDTDGVVRWVGPTGFNSLTSISFANGIYISGTPPSGSNLTGIWRIDLDGTLTFVHDYSDIGVTSTGHHNADPGKLGMLWEVTTTTQTESVILELDPTGTVLNTWNLANIISAAMTAGGDDPTQFVQPAPTDWFHNNASTYRKSDNTLIVSSRENFVIALDYDRQQIKWILGDPTKKWYEFPSLRQYALALEPNSLPPIGQHAVSITFDDDLLLFDDGLSSLYQMPPGADRTYSTPRKYYIDAQAMTASEVWNDPNGELVYNYSPVCSSVYEDEPLDYLIDYADNTTPGMINGNNAGLVGLDNASNKVFEYHYITNTCSTMWNSIPIHLEQLKFTSVVPLRAVSRKVHGAAGTFDMNLPLAGAPAIECRNGGATGDYQMVVTFFTNVGLNGATVIPGSGGTASVSGPPIARGHQVTVNLTNVSNAQTLTVNLIGVNDSTNTDDVSIPMGVLLGDVNESGVVDGNDVSAVQSHTRQPLTNANFQYDVNTTGVIDGNDVSITQSHTRTSLP